MYTKEAKLRQAYNKITTKANIILLLKQYNTMEAHCNKYICRKHIQTLAKTKKVNTTEIWKTT